MEKITPLRDRYLGGSEPARGIAAHRKPETTEEFMRRMNLPPLSSEEIEREREAFRTQVPRF